MPVPATMLPVEALSSAITKTIVTDYPTAKNEPLARQEWALSGLSWPTVSLWWGRTAKVPAGKNAHVEPWLHDWGHPPVGEGRPRSPEDFCGCQQTFEKVSSPLFGRGTHHPATDSTAESASEI